MYKSVRYNTIYLVRKSHKLKSLYSLLFEKFLDLPACEIADNYKWQKEQASN
jgi:hypothetical protein